VRIAHRSHDLNKVLSYLDGELQFNPDNHNARLQRARILSRHGEIAESISIVDELLSPGSQVDFTTDVLKQLFQMVQFCHTGYRRFKCLQVLRERVLGLSRKEGRREYGLLAAELDLALRDYKSLSARLKQLQHSGEDSPIYHALSNCMNRYRSQSFPDYYSPKVFGIGLSRTATTSLHHALTILNYRAIHWNNPYTRGAISRDDLFFFDAFSDAVVAYQFELLYHTFPNAKFIYTDRSMDSWVNSISRHYKEHHNIDNPQALRAQVFKLRLNLIPGWAEANLYCHHSSWEEPYVHHHERVKKFFRDKPKERFLQLRICEGEGWERLSPFLGREIPDTAFPNRNRSVAL